jgi:hypothetical protein
LVVSLPEQIPKDSYWSIPRLTQNQPILPAPR